MSHAPGHEAAAAIHSRKVTAMTEPHLQIPTNASPAGMPVGGGRQLPTDEELREITTSLRGLRFGSVNIIVQDGVIIQIERAEKRRLRTRREANESSRI